MTQAKPTGRRRAPIGLSGLGLIIAMLLLGTAIVVVWPVDTSDGQSVWQQRWPTRGDLASDPELMAEAAEAVGSRHILWAGHLTGNGADQEGRPTVLALDDTSATDTSATDASGNGAWAHPAVVEYHRTQDGHWETTGRAAASIDPRTMALPLTLSTGEAYLVAADMVNATSLSSDGVAVRRQERMIENGLARMPPQPCGVVMRFQTSNEVRYLAPWGWHSDAEIDRPDNVNHLVSLAAAAACVPTAAGVERVNWDGEPRRLTLPDGRTGALYQATLAPSLGEPAAPTLVYALDSGAPAVVGQPRPPFLPGDHVAAVMVGLLLDGPAIVTVGPGAIPATMPPRPIAASNGVVHVLGPLSPGAGPTAVIYVDPAGAPVRAEVL